MVSDALTTRERGVELLREGSIADSIEFLLQAIAEDPSDINLYLWLGLAYAHEGDFDKSISILEQAADVAPISAKVHYNLGVAYYRAKNLTQAKDEFIRAAGLDPNYTAARNALEIVARLPNNTRQIDNT